MQKRFKEGLLKILKDYENLQRSALKMNKNDLKNFRSNSESSEGPLKSFKDASEGKIEFRAFSEDFNEDQLKAE